jgi:5'-3' exonuclease
MGVPSFFAWLLRKFKNKILLKSLGDKKISYLYKDANCLFHPECAKIKEYYLKETDINKLEDKMFRRIANYLNYIEYFVNPINTLYTSVDGVAPLAKMCQQRKRRFKSIDENKISKLILFLFFSPYKVLYT